MVAGCTLKKREVAGKSRSRSRRGADKKKERSQRGDFADFAEAIKRGKARFARPHKRDFADIADGIKKGRQIF